MYSLDAAPVCSLAPHQMQFANAIGEVGRHKCPVINDNNWTRACVSHNLRSTESLRMVDVSVAVCVCNM